MPDFSGVPVVDRKEFLEDIWDYRSGQHVTILGPTQRGKTTLGLELLDQSISEDQQVVILAGKPPGRDPVVRAASEKLNLRVINQWPPTWTIRDKNKHRRGYVLQPHQTMEDLERDNANVRHHFRKAMMSNYAASQPVITFVDEAHHVQNDMKLRREFEAPLMRGAPINGQWQLIQRGRYMSYLVYDAPEHLFIFYDPDISNQKRYAEIGGVDPQIIMEVTQDLRLKKTQSGTTISECLYVKRSGPELMVIGT